MEVISLKEVKARGLKRYYTGEPCRHGHVCERVVSSRACTRCATLRKRQWEKDNREKYHAQKDQEQTHTALAMMAATAKLNEGIT